MVAITVATNVTIRTGAQGIQGPGGGNVSSPGGETAGNLAEFTGNNTIAETSLTTTAVAAHLVDTSNPHSVTAAQAGAEPAGAIATHAALPDAHHDELHTLASHSDTTTTGPNLDAHIASTANPHSVTAAQAGAEPAGSIATHAALSDAHHPQVHTIVSHDTTATGSDLTTLTDGSDADSKHVHAIADAHIADTTAHTGLLDLAGTRTMTGNLDTGGNDIIGAIPLGGTLTEIGIADYLDEVGSVGFFGDPAGLITASGINFDVAAGTGAFHTTASAVSPLGIGDWPAAATNAIPLNSVRYVGVEWNSATPQVVVKTTNVWTLIQEWPLGTVTRDSDGVHATPVPIRLSNFASLMDQRISETDPFARANGLNLGNSLLTVQRTSGRGWLVTTPQDFVLFDSGSSDTFDRYFQDSGSGFNVQLNQTSFEDQSFEDGSGTLATLTNNRFGVRWWYMDIQDGSLSMMYGTSNTNDIAVALIEEPPSDLPPRLQVGNILLGRYVFAKSGGVAIDVADIWGTTFSAGGGGDGDVTGPAGGVVANEIPVFVDTTGKAIGGSGILSTDVELTANKGAVSGYASLDASQIVVEPAQVLRTTTGPTSLTIGAIANGEVLVRSGTTIVGSTAAAGNVNSPGSETAGRITKFTGSNAIDETATTETELATAVTHSGIVTGNPHALDAADVSAEPSGAVSTHNTDVSAHANLPVESLASAGIDGAVAIADGAGGLVLSNSVIQNSKTGLVDVLTNLISINAGDPAKVDIRASQGVVINFDPDPTDPSMVDLVWAVPFLAITLPNLASAIATSVFVVDGGGGTPAIELSNSFPTSEELRTKLFMGVAIHSGTTIVDAVSSSGVTAFDTGSSLDDVFAALGDRSRSGNLYSANSGGNLLLDKSSGVAFGRGLNPSQINNPHNLDTSLQTAIGLYAYSFQDGASGFDGVNEITIDPDNYDDGSGTLATTSNKYTIQRLIFSPRAGGLTAVEYGQTLYNSQNDAIDGITANGIVKNPNFEQAILRGWLVVQGGTTDLTNTADAVFRENINEIAQPSGAGTDVDAIHVNGSNEISSIATKSTVVAGDLLVIENSEAGFSKSSVPFSSLDARYAELTGAAFTGEITVAEPTTTTSATTKGFVEALVQGIEWQDSVISDVLATPPAHVEGARYLIPSGATGDWSGNVDDITQSVSSVWVFTTATEGMTVAVDNISRSRRFTSGSWISLGSTIDHGNTIGLDDDDHAAIYFNKTLSDARFAQLTGAAFTGAITTTSTFDGRDVDADGTAQDTHIADTANPHGTDLGNLGSGTLAELNTAVTDATLDTSSASRTPSVHALGGAEHSSATLAQLNALVSDATLDTSSASRTPTSHASDHSDGGSDEIKIENLGATSTDDTQVFGPDGSGGVEVKTVSVFGTEFAFVENPGDHTETTTTKQSLVRLPASGDTTYPAGTYKIDFSLVWELSNTTSTMRVFVEQGGSSMYTTSFFVLKANSSNDPVSIVFTRTIVLTAGGHNFELQFSENGTSTATAGDPQISIYRVA